MSTPVHQLIILSILPLFHSYRLANHSVLFKSLTHSLTGHMYTSLTHWTHVHLTHSLDTCTSHSLTHWAHVHLTHSLDTCTPHSLAGHMYISLTYWTHVHLTHSLDTCTPHSLTGHMYISLTHWTQVCPSYHGTLHFIENHSLKDQWWIWIGQIFRL